MRERSMANIIRLFALVAVVLLVLAGCSKKEPASSMPAGGSGTSASGTTPSWTPETNPTPSLEVQSSADVYNKQGVLKRIHFETDKWTILPEDRAILKENAAWLLAHTQFKVTVEGHCDERNTEAYNLALGERRANAAKEYLIGLGVAADKIQTVSYGKSRPLCTEHAESCWQQNRRDEFLLQDAK